MPEVSSAAPLHISTATPRGRSCNPAQAGPGQLCGSRQERVPRPASSSSWQEPGIAAAFQAHSGGKRGVPSTLTHAGVGMGAQQAAKLFHKPQVPTWPPATSHLTMPACQQPVSRLAGFLGPLTHQERGKWWVGAGGGSVNCSQCSEWDPTSVGGTKASRARETSAGRSCPVLLHLEFLQQRPLGWLRLAEAGPAALGAVRSPGTALCCLPAPAGSSGLVTACHTGPPGRRGGAEALDPWGKRMGTGSGELTRPGLEVRWAGIMFTS